MGLSPNQHTPPTILIWLWASFFILTLGQSPPPPPTVAGVYLRSITLFKQYNWFEPSIYFQCDQGNVTNLSFVKQLMRYYRTGGDEAWQPLINLSPHTCETCGVYERGWVHDPWLGKWNICTSNFSTLDSNTPLTIQESGIITLNLACPQCPVEDLHVQKEEVAPVETPSRWFTILLACFAVAGVIALTMTVVAIIIYSRKDSSPLVFEEQSKMLEMERSESGARSLDLSDSEKASSKGLEKMQMEKRHTGSLLMDDRDDYV